MKDNVPEFHEITHTTVLSGRYGKKITRYTLRYSTKNFDKAGCKGIDTDVFYPPKDLFTRDEERMIESMCIDCPIMMACLEWGLAHERYGVWGGTTPAMRHRIRKNIGWAVSDPQL
jgi:hypothetical protein